ncbi:hypothetical protein MY04_0658 [Flammeovirga sp. MY04]|uniref:HNH endonuclease n=1 Tax=Flammeovirga sp. MY04 TaxID=1191459 RepID=UPI0008063D4C|nr:HNH endonuclease [Flammeovirga sp. MY04]ANQ48040.1 hypothetical protein MY04_0658 [Flammeovirga sp. MY04]
MADAICRWRNPYINNVRILIDILPKVELTIDEARTIVNDSSTNHFRASFYRTPYQLACQLGLYHETDGHYFPKFRSSPSQEELEKYLKNWIIHYTVPNPYTSSLPSSLTPFSIHAEICRMLAENGSNILWDETINELFGFEIGNKDILKNSFIHSPILKINNDIIGLKTGFDYDQLSEFINVDINRDSENKEYFFDLFNVENSFSSHNPNDLIQNITEEEKQVLNELEVSDEFSQTEKLQIVKARIGQGVFRRSLIEEIPFCPITSVNDVNLLIASHIKPWSTSNNIERIDHKNGFLFTPTYDKLFDKGYISFREDKRLIISPHLSLENSNRLSLQQNMMVNHLPIEGREEYLTFHRDVIFKF